MRVTQNMMVNDAIKWIAMQTEKLNDASNIVASGKQINKPSDDPEATKQILTDRTTISSYAQYLSSIDQANTWVEADNETLEAVGDLIQEAEDIVADLDATDDDTTASYLEQLGTIYEQMLAYANTKFSGDYMYSGDLTDSLPFADEVVISDGTPADVVFALAEDVEDVTISITDASGTVVRTLTASSGGSEGDNTLTWNGLDDDGNLLSDGVYDFTVSATDTDGAAVASYPAYRGNTGGKEVIVGDNTTVKLNRNGGALFSQALSALQQAITALENGSCDDETISAVGNSLAEASDDVMAEQVTLANVTSVLDISETRWDNLTTIVESNLSSVETGSTEEAAVKLQAQETAYEVTLETTASMLKMSKLSDYI